MTRILLTRPYPDRVVAAARDLGEVVARQSDSPLTRDDMIAALRDFDVVMPTLGDLFAQDIFAACPRPRARILANFGVGYNHIDVDAARRAGVVVTNTPGAVTEATADIAMMLILMTCRRAGEGERLVRAGRWPGWAPTQMLGQQVAGKHVGIVGMGRIGKAVARRCQAGFGMQVSFFNRSPVSDPGVPARQVDDLRVLAAGVDMLVICVPGGAATRHLIDAPVLDAMAPHACLINIARGDVVDENALIAALQAGGIGGAGLDVYENEPDVPAGLRAREDVVLLPHLGTATLEVRAAMGLMAIDNIRAVLAGRPAPNAL